MKKRNSITVLNMASTLILSGISIFTLPLFSRLLGTSGYGVMSTYTVWTQVLTIVASMNTYSTIVYARVKFPEEEQLQYQSAVMTLSLTSAFLCSVLILLFAGPISALLKLSYGLMIMLVIQSFGTFCINFMNTKLQYELKAGKNLILSLLTVGISLPLSIVLVLSMVQEDRYIGRILGNVITYGALGAAACVYILVKGKTFFRMDYWKFCLKLVLPLIFMDLSYLVLGHSDLVMLRDYMGDSAAGIYGFSYTFGSIIFTIFTALNKSWVPFFFDSMKEGNTQRVHDQAKNFLELYTVLSMGFVLLNNEMFHLFGDRSYWDGTILIPVFTAGYYFNFLCTFPVNFEHYNLKVKIVSAVTILSSALNVCLNYILIRKMGMLGAVTATCICQGFQFLVHQFYTTFCIPGKASYPFRMGLLWKYPLFYAAAAVIAIVLPESWLIRWGLGAAIGIWELLRIRQRKVLL